jgi:hypothetical protein
MAVAFVASPVWAESAPLASHAVVTGAVETGLAMPAGAIDAERGHDISTVFGPAWHVGVEVGVRPWVSLSLLGFGAFGLGGVAGVRSTLCADLSLSCSTDSLRLGVKVRYHLLPDGLASPWFAYGMGYEWAGFRGHPGAETYRGVTFFDLSHGVTFRPGAVVGVGPFFDVAIGRYYARTYDSGIATRSADVGKTAFHTWVTVGAQGVLFP